MRFEWDEKKAAINLRKHGISFDEAESVFDDPLSASFPDADHSTQDDRWYIIGRSEQGRLFVIYFTWRGDAIRLISARRPTKQEIKKYEEGKRTRP